MSEVKGDTWEVSRDKTRDIPCGGENNIAATVACLFGSFLIAFIDNRERSAWRSC